MVDIVEIPEEEPETQPEYIPVLDPDNPQWHILPVRRGITKRLEQLWDLCQKYRANIIGGYVRYMISPDDNTAGANDVDVFMEWNEDSPLDVHDRWQSLLVDLEAIYTAKKDGPLSTYFWEPEDADEISVNVIIPRDDENMVTVGSIYEIMNFFDFPVVRCALRNLTEASVDPDFWEDETKKQLHWKHINCPVAAMYRMLKYSRKGYFARPREAIKILIDWEERSPEYKQGLWDALQREDPDEDQIMELERLLWVD